MAAIWAGDRVEEPRPWNRIDPITSPSTQVEGEALVPRALIILKSAPSWSELQELKYTPSWVSLLKLTMLCMIPAGPTRRALLVVALRARELDQIGAVPVPWLMMTAPVATAASLLRVVAAEA
jgi:hypothetical protein